METKEPPHESQRPLRSPDKDLTSTGHYIHYNYDWPDVTGTIHVWVEVGNADRLCGMDPLDLARICRLQHNGRMRVTVYRDFRQREGIVEDVVGTRIVRETGEIVKWGPLRPMG
jgi:hypothetical protein